MNFLTYSYTEGRLSKELKAKYKFVASACSTIFFNFLEKNFPTTSIYLISKITIFTLGSMININLFLYGRASFKRTISHVSIRCINLSRSMKMNGGKVGKPAIKLLCRALNFVIQIPKKRLITR